MSYWVAAIIRYLRYAFPPLHSQLLANIRRRLLSVLPPNTQIKTVGPPNLGDSSYGRSGQTGDSTGASTPVAGGRTKRAKILESVGNDAVLNNVDEGKVLSIEIDQKLTHHRLRHTIFAKGISPDI